MGSLKRHDHLFITLITTLASVSFIAAGTAQYIVPFLFGVLVGISVMYYDNHSKLDRQNA